MGARPNFFIIGAARAATSSLYYYLREHPEIFMAPTKEPRFFGFHGTHRAARCEFDTLEDYLSLFDGVREETVIGEATPTYLALPESAAAIHAFAPQAKLLASLRNPVDRAFSYYEMAHAKGHVDDPTFEHWIDHNDFWLTQGRYADALTRYRDLFGESQLHVVLFEDVQGDPIRVIDGVHRFLGVTPLAPAEPPPVFNVGGKPRTALHGLAYRATANKALNRRIKRFLPPAALRAAHALRRGAVRKSPMRAETRERLTAFFADDIVETGELIGRDLSAWLEPAP